MPFSDYLRFEGRCAVLLGVALVLIAAVLGDWDAPAWLAPVVAVGASVLAAVGARAATRSAIKDAGTSAPRMATSAVQRQTVLETVAWAVAVGVWLAATGSSAELAAGTGVATTVFGIVRLRMRVPADVLVDRRLPVIGASATRAQRRQNASTAPTISSPSITGDET